MPKLKKRALLLLVVLAMLPASLYGCTGGTTGFPLWNVTPSRRVKVYVVPSSESS